MLRYFVFLFLPFLGSSQSELSIGEWATHLPFNNGNHVTQSDQFVYFSTDFAILKINKEDYSFERITRTEGLSDSRIRTIYFHKPSSTLLVAYENGILDLVTESGVKPVVDLLNFNNIPIDKFINTISYQDEQHVFISGNYGISQLDVRTGRFNFTLFTPNIKVYDCTQNNNEYFLATESGIYLFEDNGTNIIQNFGGWQKLGASFGLPENGTFNASVVYKGSVFVSGTNEIFQWKNKQFNSIYNNSEYTIKYLNPGPMHLLAGLHCKNNCGDRVGFFNEQLNLTLSNPDCTEKNLYSVESGDGTIWYADVRWSFRYSSKAGESCNSIWISGPATNNCFEIAALEDGVYVASGGLDATFTPNYIFDGILKYSNKTWSSINSYVTEDLKPFEISDVIRIAEHPDKTKIYYASAGKGLIEYNRVTDHYTVYNKTNSPLQGTVGDSVNIRLSGLAFDKEKTLWITNYLAPTGLLSLNTKGDWKKYIFPNNSNLFSELKIDQNGYKWIINRLSGGILVFDEGDPNVIGDDKSILLTTSNTEMTTNDVRTVEVDLDGDVWVGTAEGPVVFECGSSIFDGSCKGSRRKVDQDGIIYYLLSSEIITTIAIDGANRKWFGTNNNGIYVQSPGGEFQIYNFNVGNSPLMDNNILDINIDPKTGEAWIATARGLQVFRTDATLAKNVFIGSPLVFPNPVPPEYDGPIAIKGLARDARIKITDLSGRLVFETIANGGEAIWDGRDYLGKKASSGVYLVFANSTQDFETAEAIVTKIVLVR
ncbi:MAG: hypothetical protein IPG12_05280 [Saprospiraceae bacterium]|nr:hypothetical protein [Saprospiraceae bacterium]